LGDTHSLILTAEGNLMTCGSNDKYQLGINPDKRDMKLFEFTQITHFKTGDKSSDRAVFFKEIFCWNLNAAIDQNDKVYLWGILHDKLVK
jgi:alpha-tubulin suppressor-like RCC1 family protein